jgi:hypothetical protein
MRVTRFDPQQWKNDDIFGKLKRPSHNPALARFSSLKYGLGGSFQRDSEGRVLQVLP